MAAAKPDTRRLGFCKARLAWAYYCAGQKENAITAKGDVLGTLEKLKGKFDFGDTQEHCEYGLKLFNKPAKK